MYVAQPTVPQPIASATLSAASQLGIREFDSPNGAMMESAGGISIAELRVKGGRRESVYDSYIRPRHHYPNLRILTNALVTRLVLHGSKVVGIEAVVEGQLQRFNAGCEVILSLGAVNTPKVLMQSGIGPQDELRATRDQGIDPPARRRPELPGSCCLRVHMGVPPASGNWRRRM